MAFLRSTALKSGSPMPTRPPIHQPPHAIGHHPKQRYDRDRGTSAQRGYDYAWRALRISFLRDNPLCCICAAANIIEPATVADHMQTIADRPDLRMVRSNLRPLCKPHHDAITARQVAEGHRGPRGDARR